MKNTFDSVQKEANLRKKQLEDAMRVAEQENVRYFGNKQETTDDNRLLQETRLSMKNMADTAQKFPDIEKNQVENVMKFTAQAKAENIRDFCNKIGITERNAVLQSTCLGVKNAAVSAKNAADLQIKQVEKVLKFAEADQTSADNEFDVCKSEIKERSNLLKVKRPSMKKSAENVQKKRIENVMKSQAPNIVENMRDFCLNLGLIERSKLLQDTRLKNTSINAKKPDDFQRKQDEIAVKCGDQAIVVKSEMTSEEKSNPEGNNK